MSTRTANWIARTTPGGAPPPPSRAVSSGPPPTIYPESSVSNPNASRYTGRPSRSSSHSYSHSSYVRSHSVGPPPVSSTARPHTRARSSSTSHSYSSSHYSHSDSTASHRSGLRPTPVDTYYAPPRQPIIARTSDASGRTDSYMIIPAKGQRVEILHPTPARSVTPSPSSSASSYYSSSSSRHGSSTKEKPLLKKLFGKVEWGSKGSSTSSRTSSSRTRRNSTGGSGTSYSTGSGWTVVPGGSGTRVVTSGGRVVSGSGSGRVVYV